MTELGDLGYYEIVFPKLGIDITVNSVAFTIFGMQITWYGLIITFGMLLAMIYGFSQMKRYGIDPDRAIDAVIGGIVGGIVGARIYYVLFHWDSFAGDWKSVFNIRGGGLAIYGGVIGALLVGKLRKVKLMPMLDIVAVGFLLGQGIGRWGNFTNHEAFGTNTDSIFGMSSGKIQEWIVNNTAYAGNTLYGKGINLSEHYPVHPCFLYESVWCLLGFFLLAYIARKHRKFDGQIFLMYVAWYGFERFFVEGLRTDSLYIGTLRVSQVLAAVSCVTAIVLLIVCYSRVKRMGADYHLYCDTAESKQLLAEAAAREENARKKREGDVELTEKILAEDEPEDTEPEAASEEQTSETSTDKD